MENSGVGLTQLLVATDVLIHRQVCVHLRYVPPNEIYSPAPIRRTSSPSNPVPILDAPWDTISVDFIVELPESNGKDAIMVVVDSVTKRSHLVSTVTTLSAARSAQLYLRHIWKHHGLPKKVVSDRGLQFVAEFTKELYRLLGVKLATTTAYHPQGAGQTEQVNQELEQFLRLFINQKQDDWDNLLPYAEFQYNNHIHSATHNVPFLLDTGR